MALATSEGGRADELERHLWRIAMEVRAAGLMRGMVQGYHISRPLPADAFLKWMTTYESELYRQHR